MCPVDKIIDQNSIWCRNLCRRELKNRLLHFRFSCCCCCFALSQSEFMWHKEVNLGLCSAPACPTLSWLYWEMNEIRMSDGILNWISAFVFCVSFCPSQLSSLSLLVSFYILFGLFVLVAMFAGQFQATPQDRPQNGVLAFPCCPRITTGPYPVPALFPYRSSLLIAVACQRFCEPNENILLCYTAKKKIYICNSCNRYSFKYPLEAQNGPAKF